MVLNVSILALAPSHEGHTALSGLIQTVGSLYVQHSTSCTQQTLQTEVVLWDLLTCSLCQTHWPRLIILPTQSGCRSASRILAIVQRPLHISVECLRQGDYVCSNAGIKTLRRDCSLRWSVYCSLPQKFLYACFIVCVHAQHVKLLIVQAPAWLEALRGFRLECKEWTSRASLKGSSAS